MASIPTRKEKSSINDSECENIFGGSSTTRTQGIRESESKGKEGGE